MYIQYPKSSKTIEVPYSEDFEIWLQKKFLSTLKKQFQKTFLKVPGKVEEQFAEDRKSLEKVQTRLEALKALKCRMEITERVSHAKESHS